MLTKRRGIWRYLCSSGMDADQFIKIALLRPKLDAQSKTLRDFSSVGRENMEPNHTQLQTWKMNERTEEFTSFLIWHKPLYMKER